MSLPRDLTYQLQNKLNLNDEKYSAIFADSNRILESANGVERIFDQFPFLLSDIEIQVFKSLIDSVKLIERENDFLVKSDSQQALEGFVRKLTCNAINDLLNEQGLIKSELMQVLGWNTEIQMDQQKICGIVSAYVAQSLQKLNKKISQIASHAVSDANVELDVIDKSAAALNFINKNFRKWINEEIEKSNRVYDSDYFFQYDWVHVSDKVCETVKNYQGPMMVGGLVTIGFVFSFFKPRQAAEDADPIPRFQIK